MGNGLDLILFLWTSHNANYIWFNGNQTNTIMDKIVHSPLNRIALGLKINQYSKKYCIIVSIPIIIHVILGETAQKNTAFSAYLAEWSLAGINKYHCKQQLDWLFIVASIWLVWNTHIAGPTIHEIHSPTCQLRGIIFTKRNLKNQLLSISHLTSCSIIHSGNQSQSVQSVYQLSCSSRFSTVTVPVV